MIRTLNYDIWNDMNDSSRAQRWMKAKGTPSCMRAAQCLQISNWKIQLWQDSGDSKWAVLQGAAGMRRVPAFAPALQWCFGSNPISDIWKDGAV